MSTFRELEIMSLGRVTQVVNSEIAAWIDAISIFADTSSGGTTQAETRYVDKGGNDVTGNGSFNNPFLTIQAAITSITDASSVKPYVINVAAGIYATAFVLQPWMFIVGSGRTATVLQNAAANWIGAGFAVAGSQQGGISRVTYQINSLVVDMSAMSTLSKFYVYDSNLDGVGVTVTGIANTQQFLAQNIQQLSATVLNFSITNCPSIITSIELFNTNLNVTNTSGTFLMSARIGSVTGNRAITLTCADVINILSVTLTYFSSISTPIVVVGSGVTMLGRGLVFTLTLPDADSTVTFTTPGVAGALVAADEGDNLLVMTPTADRTVTFGNQNPGTRIRVVNLSNSFNIILAGTIGTQSYVPPGGVYEYYRNNGLLVGVSVNFPQYGSGVLVNGVSALIPADISARSSIVAINTNLNGSTAIGVLVALDADRVINFRNAGGGFVIRSLTLGGIAVAADQSSFRWIVIRGN